MKIEFWWRQILPFGHVMSHKIIGPDRFSPFDVYWIQTNKQTDKPNLYIDIYFLVFEEYKLYNFILVSSGCFVSFKNTAERDCKLISNDPSCKDGNTRFTIIPFTVLSDQVGNRTSYFCVWKLLIFIFWFLCKSDLRISYV